MSPQEQFERILKGLHEAALGEIEWRVPAGLINEIVGTEGNTLLIAQGQSQVDVEFFFFETCFGFERRPDYDEQYFSSFYHRDERVQRIPRLPDGELIPTRRLYTEEEKKTSAAYNRAIKRNGIHVRMDTSGQPSVILILGDSTEPDRGWSSRQTGMIESVLPHLRQFAQVRGVLADAGALGGSLAGLLDNGRACVIQLDRRGSIVEANDRALSLLRTGDGLRDGGGFLRARTSADDDELQRLLARALPPFGVQGSAGSMTIRRPGARTRLVVHVTPVVRRGGEPGARRVAALVLVVDPEQPSRIDSGLVAQALNLTPAESWLATMVASGKTVREIAATTGRTEGTVRWHLKKIFGKLGISRQTDLVRRVLSLEGFPASRRSRE